MQAFKSPTRASKEALACEYQRSLAQSLAELPAFLGSAGETLPSGLRSGRLIAAEVFSVVRKPRIGRAK